MTAWTRPLADGSRDVSVTVGTGLRRAPSRSSAAEPAAQSRRRTDTARSGAQIIRRPTRPTT
jgi:hypothetical protein